MPLTKSSVDVTQHIVDLIDANANVLGIQQVYYGDQQIIPKYPAVVVESMPKSRDIATVRQYDITLRTIITVYFGKLQSTEITKKRTEEISEAIEDILHVDPQMSGLVIVSWVRRAEPGIAVRQGAMIRAARLMWEGRSREVFNG